MYKRTVIGALGLAALAIGLVAVAHAAGDWNAARSKAEAVKRKDEKLKRLTPATATCTSSPWARAGSIA